jgi:hypothetical protein
MAIGVACRGSQPVRPPPPARVAPDHGPAAAADASEPAPAAAHCNFDRGFAGHVGDAVVFMNLTRAGDVLSGSYFYERVGHRLELAGRATGLAVSLRESVSGRSTGQFEGICGVHGELTGTWSSPDGSRKLPFDLDAPKKPMVVETGLKFTSPAKAMRGEKCEFERVQPVFFGGATGEIERRIAKTLREATTSEHLLDPEYEREARACDDQDFLRVFFSGYRVKRLDRDLLVIEVDAFTVYQQRQATYDIDAAVLNIDLHTGKLVTIDDVVSKEDALLPLADDCSDVHLEDPPDGYVLDQGKLAYLFLEHGIKVVGLDFPLYLSFARGEASFGGPILSYGALLRDGLLKPHSPIAGTWSGTTPAPPGASPCYKRWKGGRE